MADSKHTPGPWRIFQTTGKPPFYVIGIGQEETAVGITDGEVGLGIWGADSPEAHANARLIAAAPELLAAASNLVADVRRRYPGEELKCPFMRALDAAIAKAKP